MSNNFIKDFKKFQNEKHSVVLHNEEPKEKVNETVKTIDNMFVVGGIKVKQSLVNRFKARVKDSTKKSANQFASDEEIAEIIVNHLIDAAVDNPDSVSLSALLGGEEEMESEIGEIEFEDDAAEVSDDTIEDSTEDAPEVDLDVDIDVNDTDDTDGAAADDDEFDNLDSGDDEFETAFDEPSNEEDTDEVDTEVEDTEDEDEDEDELPL